VIERLEAEHPSCAVAVLIPRIEKRYWWQQLLHTHWPQRLAHWLLLYGGSHPAVMLVPWHFEKPTIDDAVDSEEATPIEPLEAAGDQPGSQA
jgi:hypothetical protein